MTLRTRYFAWIVLATIAVGLLAAVGAVQHGGQNEVSSPSARPLPVDVITIQRADSVSVDRTYTGVLRSARASDLGFELSGKLVRLHVDEGDAVLEGQLLAELDTATLLARRKQLTAERDQAAAVLAELEAGPREERIAAVRAVVENLRSEWQLASARHRRSEQLRRDGVIAEEEYDQQFYGLKSASARLEAAQRELDELVAGTRVEEIAAQRAAVAQLEASLDQVVLQLEDCQLVAPFGGTVASRFVDEGTVVATATPVLRLVDRSNLEAWIGLPADEAAGLLPGDTHRLQILGNDYAATLTSRLPELDPTTRTRTLIWTLNAVAADELVPGLVARLINRAEQQADGFWLPMSALAPSDRGLWSALAVVPGDAADVTIAQSREVEVLYTREDRVFVRGSVVAGDRIVARGIHRLTAGQRVVISDGGSDEIGE